MLNQKIHSVPALMVLKTVAEKHFRNADQHLPHFSNLIASTITDATVYVSLLLEIDK